MLGPPSAWALPGALLLAGVLAGGAPEEKKEEPPPPSFRVEVKGKGPPMVLIPGLASSGEVWEGVVRHYQGSRQCHVLTLAGFAGQPAIPPPFLETVRKDLARYIREQKLEKPVVVGHSLGAFMAFWLAAAEPDLVGPIVAVDGLPFYSALLDPQATAESSRTMAELFRGMARVPQSREEREAQSRQMLAAMISKEKDLEKALRWSLASDPQAVGQALYEIITTDLRKEVAAIKTPTLLIAAGAGPTPARQVEAAYLKQIEAIQDRRFRLAEKARHFVMLDAEEWLLKEMDAFLAPPPQAKH
jgi:N-formylmaleamate deformylase